MVAVLAKPAHVFVFFCENHSELVVSLNRLSRYLVVVGEFVLLCTSALTLFAADA
jgi:hypothetical protein